jgi:hypothetical protein
VKPGGNVAALREKNPPPSKNQATRLTQRHDKFFENFVALVGMLNLFSGSYCPLSIYQQFNAECCFALKGDTNV